MNVDDVYGVDGVDVVYGAECVVAVLSMLKV